MSESVIKPWHWWTPFTEAQFWREAADVRPEAKEFVIKSSEVIGQGLENVVKPVSKPIYGLALLAVAVAVIVWMVKRPRKS